MAEVQASDGGKEVQWLTNASVKQCFDFVFLSRRNNKDTTNYYFTRTLLFKLYNVRCSNSDEKSITIKFDKDAAFLQYAVLRDAQENITNMLALARPELLTETQKGLFMESNGNVFVRMYMPSVRGRYLVRAYDMQGSAKTQTTFQKPRPGRVIDELVAQVKNVWCKNGFVGFNVELKEITDVFK